jgi:Predicted dehydrogenases and related proteins
MQKQTTAVFRLAVIGAGQLGSRHLQGLARLALPCEIDVIDPSPAALALARSRVEEMPANPAIRHIRFHDTLDALPSTLDYAIVATAADVRLAVVRGLLERSSVRKIVLEKVLFQKLEEYEEARTLLADASVACWVNCTRRAFPIYAQIREFFAGEPIRYLQVRGGGWGLGCNGVHFLDLLAMITGDVPDRLSASDLDRTLIPSKRAGFFEFTGTLRGRYSQGAEVELVCPAGSAERLLLTFRSERRVCIVDEVAGCAFFLSTEGDGGWERREFRLPFTSEIVTALSGTILTHGESLLPTFEESMACHLPFIDTLGRHAAAFLGTSPTFCPIT